MRRSSSFLLSSVRRRSTLPKWENTLVQKDRVLSSSSLVDTRNSIILNSNYYHQRAHFSSIGNSIPDPYLRPKGGNIPWMTLREGDMAIFERDAELLSFASLNPSPLMKDQKMLGGVMKERTHNRISRESSSERIKSQYSLLSKNRSYSHCPSPAHNLIATIDRNMLEEFRAMLASEVRLKRSIQYLGDKVNANLADLRCLKDQLTAEKIKAQQMQKENMELKAQLMIIKEQTKAEVLKTIFDTEEGKERLVALQSEWKSKYMASLEYQEDLSFFSSTFLESGFNSCKAQVLESNVLGEGEKLEFLDLDKAIAAAPELGGFLSVMQNVKKKERLDS